MRKIVIEKVAQDEMFSFEFVGYMIQQYFPNENLCRKGLTYLLDWGFTNIAFDNYKPILDEPQPNNRLKKEDIESFRDFYIRKLYSSFSKREGNYLLYWGKNNANNNLLNVDVTSKGFGPNDNFKDDSPTVLDKIYNF